jgi:hypothetical protein
MGTGGSFYGYKAAGEVKLTNRLHLATRRIMVELYFTSTYIFTAECLIN